MKVFVPSSNFAAAVIATAVIAAVGSSNQSLPITITCLTRVGINCLSKFQMRVQAIFIILASFAACFAANDQSLLQQGVDIENNIQSKWFTPPTMPTMHQILADLVLRTHCKTGGTWHRPYGDVANSEAGVIDCASKCKAGGYTSNLMENAGRIWLTGWLCFFRLPWQY